MKQDDAAIILAWENDPFNWGVSDTKTPFTTEEIETFVNQEQDIYIQHQLRLMVCLNHSRKTVGCVDLFEFDEQNRMAGVGILITGEERGKGFAKEALNLLALYAKDKLNLKKLFCNIHPENTISIALFEGCGYMYDGEEKVFGKEVNHYKLQL